MKIAFEETGKTIEEALSKAEQKLGVKKEEFKYEIIRENTGFFKKLFNKSYYIIKGEYEKIDGPLEISREIMDNLLRFMKVYDQTELAYKEKEKQIIVNITSPHKSILIGRNGNTLDALTYILNQIVSQKCDPEQRKKIIIDIENYNTERNRYINKMTNSIISKVKAKSKAITIKPLNPKDRRLVYRIIDKDDEIIAKSFGHGFYKKINISTKNAKFRKQK